MATKDTIAERAGLLADTVDPRSLLRASVRADEGAGVLTALAVLDALLASNSDKEVAALLRAAVRA